MISLYMINTTIVSYAMTLGVFAGMAGVISALYFVSSFVTRPFAGVWGDRLSRKNIFVLSSAILLAAGFFMIFARSVAFLLFLRVIQGIGYALISTTSMALAADLLPEERISTGIGYFGLTTVLGQMCGPALALAVWNHMGDRAMLVAALLLRVMALLFALFITDQHKAPARERRERPSHFSIFNFIEKRSLLPAGVGMLFSILNCSLTAFLVTYADSCGIQGSAWFFPICAFTTFLARLLCSRYTDHRSLMFTAIISSIFCVSTMLLLGFGNTTGTMLTAGAVFGVGYGTLLPVTQARSVNLPAQQRSRGSSTYYIGIDIGFAVSSVVGGLLIATVGSRTMYLCAIIPAVAAVVLAILRRGDDPVYAARGKS